jgi:thiamine-phosphate diphosphorylase/hydroxyethylthiazole kinase
VTDNTPAILGEQDLVEVVRAAVEGGPWNNRHKATITQSDILTGVTIVQLRDKTSDTSEQIRIAKALHAITKPAGIPLLINDRVDVALAAGVEGVHIGQDDIGKPSSSNLLSPHQKFEALVKLLKCVILP